MIMERQIGDKFLTPEGVELEVVEVLVASCIDCYFKNDGTDCVNINCSWISREDGKEIIFKQTK
jgi:hypothetical protein